jgi:hypothetical protein
MKSPAATDLLRLQIAETAARIEEQERVVLALHAAGHAELAGEARNLLKALRELRIEYIAELARLEGA